MKNNDISLNEVQKIVDEKTIELSKKYDTIVTSMIFECNGEWIVGYLKKPSRVAQMSAFAKIAQSIMLAGHELLESCLIKEESDIRILDMSPAYDSVNLGACLEAYKLVEISLNASKKNTWNIK